MTKDKIIQKQKELIGHLMIGSMPARNDLEVNMWKVQYDELKKELSALESQDDVSDEAITVEKRTNEFLNLGDNLNSVHDAPIMDRNQNEAIRFLAKQIDILHKMRIKSGKITNQ